MDLSKLSKGDRIVVVAGLLLVIDLLFLPWYSITIANLVTVTRTGVGSPDAFLGFLGMLVALVMVLQIVLARFTDVKLPDLPIPWPRAHMLGGAVALILLLLKLVLHTSYLGFGAYLAILLAIGLTFGGVSVNNEATKAGSAG